MILLDNLQKNKGESLAIFEQTMNSICTKLGINPNWLMMVMWSESRLNAQSVNKQAGDSENALVRSANRATGLIQFMPSTAADKPYYTTTSKLAQMSFSQQLDYVDLYLGKNLKKVFDENGKVKNTFNQTDLFMTIFYPVSVGYPTFKFPENVQRVNSGISTPIEYTQRALRNPPFPLESYPSSYKEFLERFGDISGDGFLNPNRKWWVVPTIVVTFGVITTMIVYLYKKRKNG